ncbi:MAG TPA: hypothetical protein VHF02_06250 [Luteimonas sp.]|nr:hypothetical protein [Luteimonas sp.]
MRALRSQWLHAIVMALPGFAINWTLALMACIGLSWSFGRLRPARDLFRTHR